MAKLRKRGRKAPPLARRKRVAPAKSAVARLRQELAEARAQQAATAAILKVIRRSSDDAQPVFDAIVRSSLKLLDGYSAALMLVKDGLLHLLALTSTSKAGDAELKKRYPRPVATAISHGRAISSRRPFAIADTERVPASQSEARTIARARGYRSAIFVPLLRGGVAIGSLSVTRAATGEFDRHTVRMLETFAEQAVIAIENMRRFNETKEALERQTATAEILNVIASSPSDVQPVFDAIAKSAQRLIRARYANVVRRVDEMLHLVAYTVTDKAGIASLEKLFPTKLTGQAATGKAVLTGRPAWIVDVETDPAYSPTFRRRARVRGWRSLLVVPMLREGRSIGAINVTRPEPGEFSHQQVSLLQAFADQAVIAIENVRLFNETKEALERQTATAEILKVISGSPTDTQPVFEAIVQSGLKLFPNAAVVVTLPDGDRARLAAIADPDPLHAARWKKRHQFPLTREYMHAVAILDRMVIDVPDAQAYEGGPLAAGIRNFLALGNRAITIMPMQRADSVIGTISVIRRAPGPLTEKQIALLRTFADQAVIAIENVRLFNELEARNREATVALERQTATAEILKVIASSPSNVQPVFDVIARSAAQLCGATFCGVFTYDGEKIHHAAHHNLPAPALELVRRTFPRPPDESSPSGRAILTRSVQRFEDVQQSAGIGKLFGETGGWRKFVAVPMLREGVPLGTIGVAWAEAGSVPDEQVDMLQTFADQAVIAIENVRLFNETKEALEHQTATAEVLQVISGSISDAKPVFDKILRSCQGLFPDSGVSLGLLGENHMIRVHIDPEMIDRGDGVGRRIVEAVLASHPRPARDSIYGYAMHKRQLLYYPDVQNGPDVPEGFRKSVELVGGNYSAVYAPLLWEGRGIGTLNVSRLPPAPFSDKEIRLLKTFANQAVIAIQNARLFNETKEALERQTATAEILRVISSSPTDVQPVFDAIVNSAVRLFSPWNVSIVMKEGNLIHWRAFAGPRFLSKEEAAFARSRWPMPFDPKNSVTSQLIENRQTLQILDTEDPSVLPGPRENARAGKYRSIVWVPLERDREGIGCIVLTHQQPGFKLEDKQLALLRTFADQAVIAIENVRLFNETKEALERQTATAEILRVIASSPSDVQPVFDAIAASASRLISGDMAIVTRVIGDQRHLVAFTTSSKESDEALRSYFPAPLRRGLVGMAIDSRSPVFVNDTETDPRVSEESRKNLRARGIRSDIIAPMLREDAVIGTISVSRRRPGEFASHHVSLLKTFADQAVIAIENVRLFNETREALERQTATAEILKVISSSPTDVQPVLDAIVQSAAKLFECNAGILMLEGGKLYLRAAGGPRATPEILAEMQKYYPIPFDPEHYVSSRVIADRTVAEVLDTEAPGYLPTMAAVGRIGGFRSATMAPLEREGAGIGVISLTFPETGRRLNDKQLALLKTFADQAVIAIENVRLFNETKESLERQTATADILRVISSTPTNTQPVFDAIVRSTQRLMAAKSAILLLRRESECFVAAYSVAGVATIPPGVRTVPLDPAKNYPSRVVLNREIVHLPDWEGEDVIDFERQVARTYGIGSGLQVPLVRKDEGIGVLIATREKKGPFSEKEIALLRSFADQAVIAIENVRLFNETKEALERQTATAAVLRVISASPNDLAPVFAAILEHATQLCEAELGFVFMSDGQGFDPVAQRGLTAERYAAWCAAFRPHRVPGSLSGLGRVLATKAPVLIADVADDDAYRARDPLRVLTVEAIGARTFLAVPLVKESAVIGAIVIYRLEVRPFSEKQVALLQTFADQAVIAIENVRLFNETKEALEQQTATAEILKVISGSPTDTQPVFDAIVQSGLKLFAGAGVGISIVEGGELRVVAATGALSSVAKGIHLPISRESASGMAIIEKRVVNIPDTEAPDVPPHARDNGRRLGTRSMTQAPMFREGEPVGVIGVTRREPGGLDEKQIRLLQTFADQAVIAIENVRLFKELQQHVGQLTALGEVGQAISSTLDVEQVLRTIVSRAVQITGLDGGAIYEYDESQQIFLLRGGENLRPEVLELNRDQPIRMGDGFIGRAAATRKPVQVPELRDVPPQVRSRDVLLGVGFRALLAVPLVREDHVLGALAVVRNRPGEFPPEVIALLETFATQSAIAIQNARLFREIEEKGRQLQVASQHKSQFLASMSHELRTPLNAILGFNEMLLGQIYGEVPADMQEPMQDIQKSGKHLLRLINNVLDLAKIEAGRMELALTDYSVQDTVAAVQATLRPLAAEKGLEFLATVPEDVPLAYGDSGRIAQCLMNLAGNSLKFTKAGKVEIAVAEKDGLLTYRVTDTGVGIPPDKIASLFTEFKQTDATVASEYGGTGLGLSISKKFIEMHGGRIWIDSELGKGSAFIFEVPLRVKTA